VEAVEEGYYSIPRGISTKELAEEFDISDQALTERLRRAIITLVTNTLAVTGEEEEATAR
jgi:predicted DNA binding protein